MWATILPADPVELWTAVVWFLFGFDVGMVFAFYICSTSEKEP